MKHKTHHLYYLYYPRGWIIIALLLFTATAISQEQTPTSGEFPIGAYFNKQTRTDPDYYNLFALTGMDWIVQYAADSTQEFVSPYNLMADNADRETDYIMHYSTAWYSKWEAEEDQNIYNKVGVKHRDSQGNIIGKSATYLGKQCWSTEGLSAPACSLVYGPHYHQEKLYKRWYYSPEERYTKLKYIPRFNMALKVNGDVQPDEEVCKIYVVVRHSWNDGNGNWGPNVDDTLKGPITLYVSDFQANGPFADFYIIDSTNWYQYPKEFRDNPNDNKIAAPENLGGRWVDIYGDQGIQFCIDWLRTDDKCTLYVDYIEVYDAEGWNVFAEGDSITISQTIQDIKGYAQNFSEWSNLKYWMGHSEPFSLDAYTPIKTVDAIVKSAFTGAPPLIIHFDPSWWHTFNINGEDEIAVFDSIAKPSKILLGIYPASPNWPSIRFYDYEWLRFNFQRAWVQDSSFWFKPQTFGFRKDNGWCVWRKPEPPELTSMTMLALAHGAKGIIFEWFDSYQLDDYSSCAPAYIECLVDSEGVVEPPGCPYPSTLYYKVKYNLVPRLKGKLGNTLMKLNYKGNYMQLQYATPTQPQPVSIDYLTLGLGQPAEEMNWHCGMFDRPQYPDDKYFMLDNLITTDEKSISVKIQTPDPYPLNYRFRNVEGLFDTTIQAPNYLNKQLDYPPGEGYLYEFAPVIKYGGRLLYSEATQPAMILEDDMTIENGAVLTINGVYSSKGNITLKGGGLNCLPIFFQKFLIMI